MQARPESVGCQRARRTVAVHHLLSFCPSSLLGQSGFLFCFLTSSSTRGRRSVACFSCFPFFNFNICGCGTLWSGHVFGGWRPLSCGFWDRVSVGCRCILQTNCPAVFRDRPVSISLQEIAGVDCCAQLSLGIQTQGFTLACLPTDPPSHF